MLWGIAACAGPAVTPLQSAFQRSEEQALRHYARGELPQALHAFRHTLSLAELVDDRSTMATQALRVGQIALLLNEPAQAEEYFHRVLRLAKDGEQPMLAQLGIAQVRWQRRQYGEAQVAFAEALRQAQALHHTEAVLSALNGLGVVHKALGALTTARQYWDQAEALARSVGEKRLLATTLANQAGLDLQQGEGRRAAARLEQAIALDREVENLPGLAQDLGLRARLYQQAGRSWDALDDYRQALLIAKRTGQHFWVQRYRVEIERLQHAANGAGSLERLDSLESATPSAEVTIRAP